MPRIVSSRKPESAKHALAEIMIKETALRYASNVVV